jgi:hypothetical protein
MRSGTTLMQNGALTSLVLALALAGCESVGSVAPAGNPSQGAAVGADSDPHATAEVDPCILALDNPVWRDHGGVAAYERRCGDSAP